MKKWIIILLIVLVILVFVILLIKGNNVELKNDINNNEIEDVIDIVEEINPIDIYLGKDKDGGQVKKLFDEVIKSNENKPDPEKISIELNALRGKVNASNDETRLREIQGYVGSVYSMYDVTKSGDKIYIKQTIGTRTDPEIPYEVPEQEYLPISTLNNN